MYFNVLKGFQDHKLVNTSTAIFISQKWFAVTTKMVASKKFYDKASTGYGDFNDAK